MKTTVDIDEIWEALKNDDGKPSLLRTALHRRSECINARFQRDKQKESIINDIQCMAELDMTSTRPSTAMSTPVLINSNDAIIDNNFSKINVTLSPGYCDGDSDDDFSTNSSLGEYNRIEHLVSHLKNNDASLRILALTKLQGTIKALEHHCITLPELNFAPPFDQRKINFHENLQLVSDLSKENVDRSNDTDRLLNINYASIYEDSLEAREELCVIMNLSGKILFQLIGDKFEKCRSLSLQCLNWMFLSGVDMTKHIPYLIPALTARYSTSTYDTDLEVFVADENMHKFYKRGGAVVRQDRDGLLNQSPLFQTIEPNEELRLALCYTVDSLLRNLLSKNALPLFDAYLADIVLALQSSLKDPFPDVKVAACRLLVQILRISRWEAGAKYFATGLARAALPNLRHRNTKVILAAMQLFEASVCIPDHAKRKGAGSTAITDLVGFREENALSIGAFYDSSCAISVNTLAELASHKNPRVRCRCCEMLSNFLVFLLDRYDYQQRLLPYVLLFIDDTTPAVQCKALECIENCSYQYEREHPHELIERLQTGIDGDSTIDYNIALPKPFYCRPSLGARLFVRSNMSRFYLVILEELSNWKCETRKRSADLLIILIVYCEEHLTKDFQHTIDSIAKAIEIETKADNESSYLKTLDKLHEILCLISNYIDPVAFFPLMVSRISGDSSSASNYAEDRLHLEKSKHSYLIILSFLIQGSSLHRLCPCWHEMANLLTSTSCIGSYAGKKVQDAALEGLENLLDASASNINEFGCYFIKTKKANEIRATLGHCYESLIKIGASNEKRCCEKISSLITGIDQYSNERRSSVN